MIFLSRINLIHIFILYMILQYTVSDRQFWKEGNGVKQEQYKIVFSGCNTQNVMWDRSRGLHTRISLHRSMVYIVYIAFCIIYVLLYALFLQRPKMLVL